MLAFLPCGRGWICAGLLALGLLASGAWGEERKPTPQRMANGAETRLALWHELLRQPGRDIRETLVEVNRFFNQLRQQDDRQTWGMDDYWATPEELLRAGAGDCEDFAIAKYRTLIALGIPAEQLRLVIARAYSPHTRKIERHMVLTYREAPNTTVWVLDNLISDIASLDMRRDLARIQTVAGSNLQVTALGMFDADPEARDSGDRTR